MALSGSQVTQHGVAGFTQIPYGSFAGKTTEGTRRMRHHAAFKKRRRKR